MNFGQFALPTHPTTKHNTIPNPPMLLPSIAGGDISGFLS